MIRGSLTSSRAPRASAARRRRLRSACLFAALGVLTTCAITWGIALIANLPWANRVLNISQVIDYDGVRRHSGLGITATTSLTDDVRGRMGLPLYAMSFSRSPSTPDRTLQALVSGGLEAPLPAAASGWIDAPFPLRPIWPGFVLDTLCFALLWWLAINALHSLRRHARARRGLCPRCGYNLTGATDACPECGHNT